MNFSPYKILAILIGLLSALPNRGAAAIALDSVSSLTGNLIAFTLPHTVAGADPFLTVGITRRDLATNLVSITYSGLSMSAAVVSTSGDIRSGIWVLKNPPLGTANIVVTYSGNVRATLGGVSYSGVDDVGASAINSNTGTSLAQAVLMRACSCSRA